MSELDNTGLLFRSVLYVCIVIPTVLLTPDKHLLIAIIVCLLGLAALILYEYLNHKRWVKTVESLTAEDSNRISF